MQLNGHNHSQMPPITFDKQITFPLKVNMWRPFTIYIRRLTFRCELVVCI